MWSWEQLYKVASLPSLHMGSGERTQVVRFMQPGFFLLNHVSHLMSLNATFGFNDLDSSGDFGKFPLIIKEKIPYSHFTVEGTDFPKAASL